MPEAFDIHDSEHENDASAVTAVGNVQQAARRETTRPRVQRYRALLFQFYVLAALVGFTILALFARTNAYFPIDLAVTRTVQGRDPAWLVSFMRGISWPGYSPQAALVVVLFVVLLAAMSFYREALVAVLAAVGALGLNALVKQLIARPRPAQDLVRVLVHLKDYSFPSGHVMFYTAFFGFLWFLAYTLLKHSWWRVALLIFFGGLVALVGPSRVLLGEHWFSDVLAGYLLGSLVLVVVIWVYRKISPQHSPAPEPQKM